MCHTSSALTGQEVPYVTSVASEDFVVSSTRDKSSAPGQLHSIVCISNNNGCTF